MRHHLVPQLLLLLTLLGTGCRTTKQVSPALPWLRGQPVLVVSEGAAPSEREAELSRALGSTAVRTWPGDADPALQSSLSGDEPRLERAREQAELRRIPWLLVTGGEALRLETTRAGEVRWSSEPRPGGGSATEMAAALRTAVGAEGSLEGGRLAPAGPISSLRALAVAGSWEEHARRAAELAGEWPADPAVRIHRVLPSLLVEEPSAEAEAELRRVVQINPDGESELLAVALLAEQQGRAALALRARELLVRLYPTRIDYRPELADLQGATGALRAAVDTCRGGVSAVDAEALDGTAKGTRPDEAPLALPYADLRFTLGWYLAAQGQSDASLLAYDRARQLYEAMDRPRELSDTMNNAGVVLVEAGRPAVAVPLFRRALRLRTEQRRPQRAANSRHNLARALADSRRVPEAIENWELAAREYLELGQPLDAVESLVETLEHHAEAGDRAAFEARAADLLGRLEGLELSAPENVALRGMVWFERGRGRMSLRDPEGALEAYTVALDIYQREGSQLDQAQTLYSMAVPNMALLRLEDAYQNLLDALLIAADINDSGSIVAIRSQLAEIGELLDSAGRSRPATPESLLPLLE